MKCPKCGKDDYKVECVTVLEGCDPTTNDVYHCSHCMINFIPWQQSEIKSLSKQLADAIYDLAFQNKLYSEDSDEIGRLRSQLEIAMRSLTRLKNQGFSLAEQALNKIKDVGNESL